MKLEIITRSILIILISIIFIVTGGCVQPQINNSSCKFYSGAPNAPEWVCNPSIAAYITGLGISESRGDITMLRKSARTEALKMLTENIEVKVKSEKNIEERIIAIDKKESMETIIEEITKFVTDVEIKNVYEHANVIDPKDGRYYMLLKMNRYDFDRTIEIALKLVLKSYEMNWKKIIRNVEHSPKILQIIESNNPDFVLYLYNLIQRNYQSLHYLETSNRTTKDIFKNRKVDLKKLERTIISALAIIEKQDKNIRGSIEKKYDNLVAELKNELIICGQNEIQELFEIINKIKEVITKNRNYNLARTLIQTMNNLQNKILDKCDARSAVLQFNEKINTLILISEIVMR